MNRLATVLDAVAFGLACVAIGVKLGERAYTRRFADELDEQIRERYYRGNA